MVYENKIEAEIESQAILVYSFISIMFLFVKKQLF